MVNTDRRGVAVRLLRDLIVIVLGVLVALSADAWWKSREESGQELAYLLALQSDLAMAAPQLQQAIERDSESMGINDRALESLYADSDPESFGIAMNFEDVDIPTGTITALLASGDIRLIRSPAVRSRMIAFEALLERSQAWSRSLEAQVLENFRTFNESLEEARLRNPARPGVPSLRGAVHRELRASPGFISSLRFHASALRNRIELHTEVLDAIKGLQAAIDDEVVRRTE